MRNKIRSEAFVLSKNYFSEADAVITFFTYDFGKLTFVAKGIKKAKSKKRGNLEIGNYVKFEAARVKNGMPILEELETINFFGEIKKDLAKLSTAYYLLELVSKTSAENQENTDLFFELKHFFEELCLKKATQSRRLKYAQRILAIQGFWDDNYDLHDLDNSVEKLIERKINSVRVAQKLLY